jgi:hypothetical protein
MGWSKDEVEAIWDGTKVSLCFFRNMSGMVIQNDLDLNARSIEVIEFPKKLNELRTSMFVLDVPMDMTRKKINGGQKRNDSMPLIFIVPSDGSVLARDRRKIRSYILDCLDPWFFIVGKHSNIGGFLVWKPGGPNHLHLLIGQKDLGHF